MFKDTKGYPQSPVEKYFNPKKDDLSIAQVAEYIQETPTGMYAREPIAYAFKQVAMKLGHEEPTSTNKVTFESVIEPFETKYIYDETLPLTAEEVRQAGVDHRYLGEFQQEMYGKVAVGEKVETRVSKVFQEGAPEIIAIGAKAWVNLLQPSHVSVTLGTRILVNGKAKDPQTVTDLTAPLELEQFLERPGLQIVNVPFVAESKYTISFEYQIIGSSVEDFQYYALLYNEGNIFVDGELKAEYGSLPTSEWPLTNGKHTFYMHFTSAGAQNSFTLRFNETVPDGEGEVWITKLNIHEGHIHPFKEVN